ncbi:hypothetical protein QUN99_003340 [Vibrio parahaemolyticus]|nr:hypothetical protein [Vibrio parahaemolyticus]
MNKKNTLVIACSATKAEIESQCQAFDLYNGNVYKTIKANVPEALDKFNILILSAEHGLIAAEQLIYTYDTKMVSRRNGAGVQAFAQKHKAKAVNLLESCDKGALYVYLPNDYLAIFDAWSKSKDMARVLSQFESHYVCRGHRGNLEQLSRLKRMLNAEQSNQSPTLFRSGIANLNECHGYRAAGQFLGYSLAYVNPSKPQALFSHLIDDLNKGRRVFLDNGIITAAKQSTFIDPATVIDQYVSLVSSLKPKQAKLLSCVVPDHPLSPETSLNIVRENAKELRWLAKRCDLVLPIHKAKSFAEHALSMMKTLNYCRLTLGVPCKDKFESNGTTHSIRLSISDIESLLNLKVAGRWLFDSLHFLALSEKSRGNLYSERLGLARAYGRKVSADCCRTTALFGGSSSKRQGTLVMNDLQPKMIEKAISNSGEYIAYNQYNEWDEPALHDKAFEYLDSNPVQFVELWNEKQDYNWKIDVNAFNDDTELSSYMQELILNYPSILEDELTDVLKKLFIRWFEEDRHIPAATELRAQAIAHIFTHGQQDDRNSVQCMLF